MSAARGWVRQCARRYVRSGALEFQPVGLRCTRGLCDAVPSKEERKKAFQDMLRRVGEQADGKEEVSNAKTVGSGEVVTPENATTPEGVSAPESAETQGEEVRTSPPSSSFSWDKISLKLSSITDSVKEMVREAMKEQPVVEKTYLRRKIHQAVSFRRSSADGEGLDVEEDERYSGPTEMVFVKEPLTAWESMRARISASPLLSDILKRTSRATKAASETPVGKQVGHVGSLVQDKIHVCAYFFCMFFIININIK
jgi:hypothetical protein